MAAFIEVVIAVTDCTPTPTPAVVVETIVTVFAFAPAVIDCLDKVIVIPARNYYGVGHSVSCYQNVAGGVIAQGHYYAVDKRICRSSCNSHCSCKIGILGNQGQGGRRQCICH